MDRAYDQHLISGDPLLQSLDAGQLQVLTQQLLLKPFSQRPHQGLEMRHAWDQGVILAMFAVRTPDGLAALCNSAVLENLICWYFGYMFHIS